MARTDEGADVVISIDRVTLGYGDRTLISDFSLTVGPGEAVALRGPNGAGKSTLLRCVGGLLTPRSGTVRVAGAPVDETSGEFRRTVAALLDDAAWYPSLTVREHIELVQVVNRPAPASWWDPASLTDLLELGAVAGQSPVRLSSGERQRLALAMTFARPSRVLLLDEPERHLDAAGRGIVADLVRGYRDRDGAALVATHDARLADECEIVDLTGAGDGRTTSRSPGRR